MPNAFYEAGRTRLRKKGQPLLYPFLFLALLWLVGCSGREIPVTRLVEVTRLVTGEPPENLPQVTRLVVTATPAPAGTALFTTNDPTTYIEAIPANITSLDPAGATDPLTIGLLQNVVETLLFPDPGNPARFLPLLATSWSISPDGLTYTFNIRRGPAFSNGNRLTAGDIAYTIQRALLQSNPGGPQGLLLQPLLGYTSGDVTEAIANGLYAGDPAGLIANGDPDDLADVCQALQTAIVSDDTTGRLTFHLSQAWGPFLTTLSQSWTAAIDQEWAIENGAWDGDCATWQNWYAPGRDNSELSGLLMGSGPYILDHWTPGREYVLVANNNYWRGQSNEMWPDGPAGPPLIQRVILRVLPNSAERLALLEQGQLAMTTLDPAGQILAADGVGERCDWLSGRCIPSGNPAGPLRQYLNLPQQERSVLLFNFDMVVNNNPFIGNGQLGNGIPPQFFSDNAVRRAFALCLDTGRYIAEGLAEGGFASSGPIPMALLGYTPDLALSYDLTACAESLALAWDGQLPTVGFRLQLPYAVDDPAGQLAALILQSNLALINPLYQVDVVGLSRPVYEAAQQNRLLPVAFVTQTEVLPDPHAWLAPLFGPPVATFQQLPSDLQQQFLDLIEVGSATTDPAGREQSYQLLNQLYWQNLPQLWLPTPAGTSYQQRWVKNWFYTPHFPPTYYYAYALAGN